ncbi:hypothetical protein BJY52DRAFT_1290936 [Lactarius psammicola]|nr:hypothetical protein BJY52DRAFT_1290936 [Lactarius psammicola]
MFPLAILVAPFLATLSLASPVARQTSQSLCPWNGVPNTSNFTLVSVSKADSSIQKSLALGSNGLPPPRSVGWLGSAESLESIVAENFVLKDGGITAYALDGSPVGVSDAVATEDGWALFALLDEGETIAPAEVYCELFSTSPHGIEFPYTLAVNGGDSDHFSLCKSNNSDEFVVIYNAVEASSKDAGYEWTTCTAVGVHVLPVTE